MVAPLRDRNDRVADERRRRPLDGGRRARGIPHGTPLRREPHDRAACHAVVCLHAERVGARRARRGADARGGLLGRRHLRDPSLASRRVGSLVRRRVRAVRPRHGGASERTLAAARAGSRLGDRTPPPVASQRTRGVRGRGGRATALPVLAAAVGVRRRARAGPGFGVAGRRRRHLLELQRSEHARRDSQEK